MASVESNAIETIALAKRYHDVPALVDLTMTVARGEIFGFLGPNGAGKTTAVKLLLGLCFPSSGAAEVLGAPLGDRETRRRIGYLPELFRYQDWLTAREVLTLHCRLAELPRAGRADEIARVLEVVGLTPRANDRVGTFSKGMQQRLGLAVALLGTPELVFLDEPTSALDPVGRHDVRAIIERLKTRGTTVFLNSHLLTEVERVCDRVAIVDRGRVVANGSITELLGRSSMLRLRVGKLTEPARTLLTQHGAQSSGDGIYVLPGLEEADVPALVRELVGAGAEIFALEPSRATLEDRFMELLRSNGTAGDRVADSP